MSGHAVKRKLSVVGDDLKGSYSSPSATVSPDPPSYEAAVSKHSINDNNDELVSAAEALTQLNGANNTSPSASYSSGGSPVALNDEVNEHPLVARVNQVSKHPIVTNAVKYYENSKRNYAPFNYAAGIVEKAAIPVVIKIEDNLNSRHKANQLKLNKEIHQKRRKLDPSATSSGESSASAATEDDNNLSVETKKRLQFCLHILKLANDHINSKVTFLQQKMNDKEREMKEKQLQEEHAKIQSNSLPGNHDSSLSSETLIDVESPSSISKEDTSIPSEAAQQTKTEIVTTVKKIIHVISNFKPSSLTQPQPYTQIDGDNKVQSESSAESRPRTGSVDLRTTVRDIILNLPASVQQTASTSQTNDRIFVLAKESLDMIGKLTQVFNEQLEKAETWVAGEEKNEQSPPDAQPQPQPSAKAEI